MMKDFLDRGLRVDGVVMDNSMPFLDGTKATRLIRKLGYRGMIVGVTGNALENDTSDFIANGVDEVFIKPLRKVRYEYLVQAFLSWT